MCNKNKEYFKNYYQKNKERLRENTRQYYNNNKNRLKIYNRNYYLNKKNGIIKTIKKYPILNLEEKLNKNIVFD